MTTKILLLALVFILNENYVKSQSFEVPKLKLFAGKNFTGSIVSLLENQSNLSFTFRSFQITGNEN